MGTSSTQLQRVNPAMDATVPIGGLTGAFLLVCIECQRHWPDTISLVYLVISCSLFALWVGYLTVWPTALRYVGLAINSGIFALLGACLLLKGSHNSANATELATKLLFWGPLVATWWAWSYFNDHIKLVGQLGVYFAVLIWQTAGSNPDIPEHLILSLLVAGIIYHARKGSLCPESESTVSLRDPVTGLSSAEYFEAELAHVSAISDRYQMPMSIVGYRFHKADSDEKYSETLRVHADAIIERMRISDTACRWDEKTLMVLLPNTTAKQADAFVSKLGEAMQRAGWQAAHATPTGVTVVEHQIGEDPMSTLCTLENKLSAADR